METVLGCAVSAVLFIAAAWKVRQLVIRPDDRGVRLLLVFFAFTALGELIHVTPLTTNDLLEPLLGPNGNVVFRNVQLVLCFYLWVAFLLYASGQETKNRRRVWLDAPCLAAVVTTLACWYSIPSELRTRPFTDTGSTARVLYYVIGILIVLYLTTFLGTILTLRSARRADRVAAAGLYVSVAGFVLALPLWGLPRLTALVVAGLGHTPSPYLARTSGYAALVVTAIIGIGFVWSTAQSRLASIRLWNRHRRLIARIHPLWSLLVTAFPEHVLHHDAGHRRVIVRRVHHHFYRRVVECRDGLVVAARVAPAGSTGEGPQAEARLIEDTLATVDPGLRITPGPPGMILAEARDDTVEADAEALAELAKHLSRNRRLDTAVAR